MDLGSLAVRARLRGRWEAIDLGFLMARAWWGRLFWSWFLPSTALLLALMALVGSTRLGWCILAVWWLKPTWDRLPLHIASRALFGEHVGVRAAVRELPRLAARDWFAWLTWRRFSLSRSFDLPVTVLEGLRGAARRARLRQLHARAGDAASWLTFACVNIEGLIVLAAVALVEILLPADLDLSVWDLFQEYPVTVGMLLQLGGHLAAALVAPFYTMAGFALYISRRIELEGWDIEIRFRHLAERQARSRAAGGGAVAAGTVLALLLLVLPLPAPAQDATAQAADVAPAERIARADRIDPDAAQARIAEVLDNTDFHNWETVRGWHLREPGSGDADDELPNWLERLLEWMERSDPDHFDADGMRLGIARALEFSLWVVLIALAVWLAWRYRATLRRVAEAAVASTRRAAPAPPTELFGMDLRAASLPEDVGAAVLAAWQAGQARAALALLYRASLSRLVNRFGVRLAPQHTESECVRIVAASVDSAPAACFRDLTRLWQRIAYAHRVPDTSEVETLLARWRQAFDVAA